MKALWFVQLGTPQKPTRGAVKKYLDEFLMDSRMIDLPRPARDLLVKGVITPFRSGRSAHAYRQVWMDEGSPLLVHSKRLMAKIEARLASRAKIYLSMRYGEPSLRRAWEEIRQRTEDPIIVVPLFPQYAASTQASIFEQIFKLASPEWKIPHLQFVPPFYQDPGFIRAFAEQGRKAEVEKSDAVLFSFHGLPESYVARCGTDCQFASCCDRMRPENVFCYRAQCFETARRIAESLNLNPQKYFVSFQSRLKGQKWIEPYTDAWLKENAKRYPVVSVFSPAFVADCLETLEELALRESEAFVEAGGSQLRLVPSLNSEDVWVDALLEMLEPYLKL